jgi:hypothetical protein
MASPMTHESILGTGQWVNGQLGLNHLTCPRWVDGSGLSLMGRVHGAHADLVFSLTFACSEVGDVHQLVLVVVLDWLSYRQTEDDDEHEHDEDEGDTGRGIVLAQPSATE